MNRSRNTQFLFLCFTALLTTAFLPTTVASQSREVRVGVYQNEPKIFIDETGEASGFFIDLLNEIAAQEGWEITYVQCKWAECLAMLEDGQIDLMPDVAYSEERDTKYDFHKIPVIESWSRVYASHQAQINELSDLNGQRVAVLQGSIQQRVFEQLMKGFGYEVTLVPAASLTEAFLLARDGKADAAIANHLFGDYFQQEYELEQTTIYFNPSKLYYATAQGHNSELLEAIDRNLEVWVSETNSPYYTTLGRWEGEPVYGVPQSVYWGVGITGALLVAALGMIALLRNQVRARTKYLEQANQSLQESEERFHQLFENSLDAILLTTSDGAILAANPAACQIFERTEAELKQVGYNDLVDTSDPRFAAALEERTRTGKFTGELTLLRKNGAGFPGEISIALFKDKGGIMRMSVIIRDISARKRAEASSQTLEQLFTRVFYASPIPVSLTRLASGRYLEVNDAFLEVLGYEREDVIGHTSQELNLWNNPSDRTRMVQAIDEHGGIHNMEFQFRTKTGEAREALMSVEPIDLGEEQGIIAMFYDITKRKQTEEALRRSEEQFRLIMENLADLVAVLDLDGHRIYNSPSYGRILDSPDKLQGTLSFNEIHLEDQEQVRQSFEETIRTGQGQRLEYRLVDRDGESHYIESQGSVIRDAQDNVSQVIVVSRDITERKHAEEELRRRADEFTALYETAHDLSTQHDLTKLLEIVAQQTAHLLKTSDATIYLYDPVNNELEIGATSVHIFPEETRFSADRGVSGEVVRTRQPMIVDDYRAWGNRRRRTQHVDYRAVALVPMLHHEEIIGVLGVAEIGTDRKYTKDDTSLMELIAAQAAVAIQNTRLRAKLEAYNKELEERVAQRTAELEIAKKRAESADHLKSAFLATMSHELRTPLNSIIGFTGVLLQGLAGPLNAEQAKQMGMARDSAHHLLALINDVLDISKIEAGQLEIRKAPFEMRVVIEKALSLVTLQAQKKRLSLGAALDSKVGQVVSDQRRVEQILINLLSNAVKFTERGEVRLECHVRDGFIETSVHDTGIGMRTEDMDKLFVPFRQIETGLNRRHEGTGLGLSICKNLVELLGGQINAESEWGKGSIFSFTLPLD